MKKIFTLFAVILMACASASAKTYTISGAELGALNYTQGTSITINGITITLSANAMISGSGAEIGNAYFMGPEKTGADYTISLESGETIGKVVLTAANEGETKYIFVGEDWTVEGVEMTWEGSAESVAFDAQGMIAGIEVTTAEAAATATIAPAELGALNYTQGTSITINGITITLSANAMISGSGAEIGNAYFMGPEKTGADYTISMENGATIKKVVLTAANEGETKYIFVGEDWTVEGVEMTWEGSAESVAFDAQGMIAQIDVTYVGGDGQTAVKTITTTVAPKAAKRLVNGKIMIERNGILYNIAGQTVK